MTVGGQPVQIVFNRDDKLLSNDFETLSRKSRIVVRAKPPRHSTKPSQHRVLRMVKLISINERKPRKRKSVGTDVFAGTVTRLNYSRHGVANGVMLDGGEFVHAKADAMSQLKWKVGDDLRVKGKARLMPGGGVIIDLSGVRDQRVSKRK